MNLPEKPTPSPAKENTPTRSLAQHSTRAEASEQVALPPGTHSPGRIREQQHRDAPSAYTIFYGPENYSAIRDMPMEPDSHTKGLGEEGAAIRNRISTTSAMFSPASASTVGAQTESTHRDIPSASAVSPADDRTHGRSRSPSSSAKMKEEAPLAERDINTPFQSRAKET